MFGNIRIYSWKISKNPFELTTVLFGNVFDVDILIEGGEDVGTGANDDFGDYYWVEPALDPAPDYWEEGGGADNLFV